MLISIRLNPAIAKVPDHEDILPAATAPSDEFVFDESEADDDAARNQRLRARMVSAARQASLDPADGIEL